MEAMKTYIVYHANCSDGFGSAYSAWKKLKDEAEYIPMEAGDVHPVFEPNSTIFFLDVAPRTRHELLELKKNNEVYVIDHHVKNMTTLQGIEGCIFDMKHSGAYLSWKFFNPEIPVTKFIEYIQMRDLNKHGPIEGLIINTIYCTPFDFLTWEACLELGFNEHIFTEQGIAIDRFKEFQINNALNGLHTIKIGEYYVPAINTKDNVSEIAMRLCELFPEAPFAACYSITSRNRWVFSLRSKSVDVNHIASLQGGGGHHRASGFRIPTNVIDFELKENVPTGLLDKVLRKISDRCFKPRHGGVYICEENRYILPK